MINSFRGKYYPFSNFSPVTFGVYYEGQAYPSIEHAYQASKTFQHQARTEIGLTPSPYLAKKIGKSFEARGLLREDWYDVNLGLMEIFLIQKFEIPSLKKLLIETGDKELIEGNNWCDNFWGSCYCEKCKERFPNGGLNHLGKLLMKIRKEKQNGQST